MKAFFDFFPVILFYITYQLVDIYAATLVLILASMAQVAYLWFARRQVEKMHLLMLGAVIVLGLPTLLFRNELFIKWKPTAVNWIAALIFIVSHILQRPIIKKLLNDQLTLPPKVWSRLNLSWIGFFIVMGLLNLVVVYQFSTETWVNFKFFGVLGLTICFAIFQGLYLAQYIDNTPKKP